MVKLKIIDKDDFSMVFTFNKSKEYLAPRYAEEYSNRASIKSVTLQRYPLKDNQPIDWLNNKPENWDLI